MTDLNSCILIGRLTKTVGEDAHSFEYLQNGTCKARMSLAVNRSKKGQDGQYVDKTSFFDVQMFGKMAESLKPYLVKGQQVAIIGNLEQDRWQDKTNGENKSRTYIIADFVQLLGNRNQVSNNGRNTVNAQQTVQQNNDTQYVDDGNSGFPEDIPF